MHATSRSPRHLACGPCVSLRRSVVRNQVPFGGQSRMGQPSEEWALGRGRPRAPSGPFMDPFRTRPCPSIGPARSLGRDREPRPDEPFDPLPALNEEDGVAAVLNRIPRQTLQEKGTPTASTYSTDGPRTRPARSPSGSGRSLRSDGNGKDRHSGSSSQGSGPVCRASGQRRHVPARDHPRTRREARGGTPVILGSRLRVRWRRRDVDDESFGTAC